jgi:hypothetical protein
MYDFSPEKHDALYMTIAAMPFRLSFCDAIITWDMYKKKWILQRPAEGL